MKIQANIDIKGRCMMKVKETYKSFIGAINVGKFSYFVKLDKDGIEVDDKELLDRLMYFNRVVFFGDEPFDNKEEFCTFIKKLVNRKPEIKIEVNTKGMIRPIIIGSLPNVIYNVNLLLKNSDVEYDDRIKSDAINWFVEIGANFIFYIKDYDDADEVNMIVQEFCIPKTKVYLAVKGEANSKQLKMLLGICKNNGYNFTLNYHKMFWPKDGRE